MTGPIVHLDVARMKVDRKGVEGFVWPIADYELLAVRDDFLESAIPFIKRESRGNRQASVLGLMIHVLGEVLSLYKAQATVRRLKGRGLRPLPKTGSRLLGAMLDERVPAPSGVVGMLERGVYPPAAWRRGARALREAFVPGVISMPRIGSLDLFRDIVTIAVGDMIWQHAAAVDEKVSYLRFEEWFAPLRPDERAHYGGPPDTGLLDTIMDMVGKAFAAGNEPLLGHTAHYLRDWMLRVATFADRYLTRLLKTPERVPRRLWRGTGGHPWARILSHAVRELGGHVTGHDHANGLGMFVTSHDTVVEHPGCDRFMVWTPMQREMALRNINPQFVIEDAAPEIAVVPGRFKPKIDPYGKGRNKFEKRQGSKPTIMYVGTLYNDEFVSYTPLTSDIVLVDWEARLIAELGDLGYDVIVKPHPESMFPPPAAYSDVLGATIVNDRFEEVWDSADVLIFGEAISSAFFGALGTAKPVVIVSRDIHSWQPEAEQLMRRRCGYVPPRTEESNRIGFDRNELRRALHEAPSLNDYGFRQSFLGS